MSAKVSVIVPIYNVEKYLANCIDSLIHQTLKEIEIILVDDGSPDDSGRIAEEYAKKDNRIKVVHQENAGLGPARNTGMRNATGEYIGFVDSDDWVMPEMFESLYQVTEKQHSDIVVGGHQDMVKGVAVKVKRHPLAGKTFTDGKDIDEIRKQLYGHDIDDTVIEAFPMAVWIAIYRREMIENNRLCFKEILSEDTIFNLSAYKYAKILSFTDGADYCYRTEGQPSIMRSFSNKKLVRYRDFLYTLRMMAEREHDERCVMRAKRTAIAYCRLYIGLVNGSNLSFKQKKAFVKEYVENEEICSLWDEYPVDTLPFQQKIFQSMIQKKQYGIALLMDYMRQFLKNKLRK